jgi:hypothetical protein
MTVDRCTWRVRGSAEKRAERRAAAKPARVPVGDRPPYPAGEGLQ